MRVDSCNWAFLLKASFIYDRLFCNVAPVAPLVGPIGSPLRGEAQKRRPKIKKCEEIWNDNLVMEVCADSPKIQRNQPGKAYFWIHPLHNSYHDMSDAQCKHNSEENVTM